MNIPSRSSRWLFQTSNIFMTLKDNPSHSCLVEVPLQSPLPSLKEYLQLQRGCPAFLTIWGSSLPGGLSFTTVWVQGSFLYISLLSSARSCWHHGKDNRRATRGSSLWHGSWVVSTLRSHLARLSSPTPLLEGFSPLLWSQSVQVLSPQERRRKQGSLKNSVYKPRVQKASPNYLHLKCILGHTQKILTHQS